MKTARRKYSKEFKLEAIEMYKNSERSMSEVERDLGISGGILSKWIDRLARAEKPEEVFPGNGKLQNTDQRIRQLERENLRLRQEKEILKKVLEIYTQESK